MSQARILVVDDEPDIRQLMRDILEDEGYTVELAENGETARAAFAAQQPDLVLLDIWMPDVDGISLLKEWSESGRLDCPVVMISGHGTLETAVEATRLGACDFVQKPLSLAKLLATVRQALSSQTGGGQPPSASTTISAEPQGNSPQMQLLRQRADQAARHSSPILITGEAGSGRESLARHIHRRSQRPGSFMALDACEMGSDKARTYLLGGADNDGILQEAADGTLYIHDLQSLDLEAQRLLSAVLESGSFTPDGASERKTLNCRVIAGAPVDVEQLANEGKLHDRLYLQLNVLALNMPALRERAEDVPDLVRFYTDWLSNQERLGYRQFSISALNRLRNHPWPGNERELRNLVQRLLTLGGEGEVTAQEVDEALRNPGADSPVVVGQRGAFDLPLREAREQFEREYLIYQLRKAGGSVGKLSTAVGMERTHLYRKLRSLGIDPKTVTARGSSQ